MTTTTTKSIPAPSNVEKKKTSPPWKSLAESFPLNVFPYAPMLAILGSIVYAQKTYGCPDDAALDKFLPRLYHIGVCGGPGSSRFSLGRIERIVLFVLAVIGVFGYVIPKHMKQDGAKRLYVSNKLTRVLLFHIITGLIMVLGTGLMGIFAGGIEPNSTVFWIFAIVDIIHEITILRMLKNHDGIFALRIDNATAGFAKFHALINASRYSARAIGDSWFLASWGFMGTRIAGVLSHIIMLVTKEGDGIFLEHTYSIGVAMAIHHIVFRARPYGVAIWLFMAPIVSYFYYHELWSRQFKGRFVGTVLLGSLLMLYFGNGYTQFAYMIGFHVWTFSQPVFYRLPQLALGSSDGSTASILVDNNKDAAANPVLQAVYQRISINIDDDDEANNIHFRMRRASYAVEENISEEDRQGLNFRGGKAWKPDIIDMASSGGANPSSTTTRTSLSSTKEE